jgi:hypothetical protein
MGKLYNFVMVGCTTLLEKFSKRPFDLEMHLLGGGNCGLPSAPKLNCWQSRRPRVGPWPSPVSNASASRACRPLNQPIADDGLFNDQLPPCHRRRGPMARGSSNGVIATTDRRRPWPGSLPSTDRRIRHGGSTSDGPWQRRNGSPECRGPATGGPTPGRTPPHQGHPSTSPPAAARAAVGTPTPSRTAHQRRSALPSPVHSKITAVHTRNPISNIAITRCSAICDHDG